MNDKSRDCLVRILFECDKVLERKDRFSITKDVFTGNAAYADMLLMPLAQIGDLSVHVADDVLKGIMPLAVWRQVWGFRNVIVHHYGTIDRQWAWETVDRDVPELRSAILAQGEVRAAYEQELDDVFESGDKPSRSGEGAI